MFDPKIANPSLASKAQTPNCVGPVRGAYNHMYGQPPPMWTLADWIDWNGGYINRNSINGILLCHDRECKTSLAF